MCLIVIDWKYLWSASLRASFHICNFTTPQQCFLTHASSSAASRVTNTHNHPMCLCVCINQLPLCAVLCGGVFDLYNKYIVYGVCLPKIATLYIKYRWKTSSSERGGSGKVYIENNSECENPLKSIINMMFILCAYKYICFSTTYIDLINSIEKCFSNLFGDTKIIIDLF